MKISIDTAQDSKEEIRKAIRLLQALTEHDASQGSRNLFDSPGTDLFGNSSEAPADGAEPANAFGSMFGDDAPAPSVEVPEKKEKHKVELY